MQDLITGKNEVLGPQSWLCVYISWLFLLSKMLSLGCWVPAPPTNLLYGSVHLLCAVLLERTGQPSVLNLHPLDSYSSAAI